VRFTEAEMVAVGVPDGERDGRGETDGDGDGDGWQAYERRFNERSTQPITSQTSEYSAPIVRFARPGGETSKRSFA
jgi:hypothetical protein